MTTKPKRKRKKAKKPDYSLTPRDLEVLAAIHDYGGVLTTVQISILHWPPDVARRLASWQVPPEPISEWTANYPAGYLADKVEQLKWGTRVNRIRGKAKPSKAEEKLIAWIAGLEPLVQEELRHWLDTVAAMSGAEWLARAVSGDPTPPLAFSLRHRLPSDEVSSACKTRLRYLAQHGLIQLQEQATRLSEGRAQACWFLSAKGRNVLAAARGVAPGSLDWKRTGAYGSLHLDHRLAINDFRIAVELACRQKGYRIRRWLDDNRLKRELAGEKVTMARQVRESGSGETQVVQEEHALKIPDGFFWLDMGRAGQRHCFFELDNRTLTLNYTDPNPKDYAQKVRTLAAFYLSGRYAERFPEAGQSMWFLTVTTGSKQRLDNLRRTAESVGGRRSRGLDRYWFARMQEIPVWQDVFAARVFAPIWQRGGSDRLWRLDEER